MPTLDRLIQEINYTPNDPNLLRAAITHKSYLKQHSEAVWGDNERLEFLGDAVVDLIIADILFDMFPDDTEGHLSRKRASLVNEESLYNIAMRIRLDDCLLVEENQSLRTNKRVLSGALEAVIGAIYEDSGFDRAKNWVSDVYHQHASFEFAEHDFARDYKTRFQELIQEKWKVTPNYRLVSLSGPDHAKTFRVQVLVNDEVHGEGEGESKKIAEQMAAQAAMKRFTDGV